jgi:hypothetical protein
MAPSSQIRRVFLRGLFKEAAVVWPVISGLITVIAGLGALVAHLEGWPLFDGLYFSFITGLTVGYGDLAPQGPISRILAVAIAFSGVLLTALLAAIAVRALQSAAEQCQR